MRLRSSNLSAMVVKLVGGEEGALGHRDLGRLEVVERTGEADAFDGAVDFADEDDHGAVAGEGRFGTVELGADGGEEVIDLLEASGVR